MNWFQGCSTVAEIKKRYHKLAFTWHPDVSKNPNATAVMKEINAAYHAALKNANKQTSVGADKKQHTYYYNKDIEQAIIDKIAELLSLKMIDVTIELVGTWVWIHGNTRAYKEQLKTLKCKWNSKRKMWYWHNGKYRKRHSPMGFDYLRRIYGAEVFKNTKEEKLQLAMQS